MPHNMHENVKASVPGNTNNSSPRKELTTPLARLESHLLPVLSPIPRHRLSPAIEEFSLRRTPSRGATASPAPAKGVRKRLHQYRNFDHAVDLLKQSKNVIVLTGAGISTSVGIPDFRSDKGLYSQLSKDLGITEAEEFFSREYFIHNTAQFFEYVKKVIPEAVVGPDGLYKLTNPSKATKDGKIPVPEFSLTHAFLALLHVKRKLLTNYTQNIDGLETAAGVPSNKFVQCHGSWNTASCMTCGRSSAAKKYLPVVFAGNIPYCKCKLDAERQGKSKQKKKASKKRSWEDFDSDHSSDDGTKAPRGLMKPDITFFNERLCGSYGDRLDIDKRKIDLLIIIGTSLKVGPVQDMLYQISPKVPQIFISKERFSGALCNLPGVQVDIELLGECDVIIEELCRRAGWLDQLKSLCWEQGQSRIKMTTTHDATPQSTQAQLEDISPTNVSDTGLRHRKKLKRQPSPLAQRKPEVDTSSEKTGVAPLPTGSVTTMVNEDNFDLSQESIQTIDYAATPRSSQQQHDKIDKSKVISQAPKDEIQPNHPTMDITRESESPIKLELVEGTAHQWRVSKK